MLVLKSLKLSKCLLFHFLNFAQKTFHCSEHDLRLLGSEFAQLLDHLALETLQFLDGLSHLQVGVAQLERGIVKLVVRDFALALQVDQGRKGAFHGAWHCGNLL